jgi:excisionase family DNA binding protein
LRESIAGSLRRLADTLPEGAAITLTRVHLLALLEADSYAPSGHDLTAAEAAQALGCSTSAVRRLLESERLGGYKIGSGPRAAWRIPQASLAAFRAPKEAPRVEHGRATDLAAWRRVPRPRGTA